MECIYCHKIIEKAAPICRHCGAILPPEGFPAREPVRVVAGGSPEDAVAGGKPASVALAVRLMIASWVIFVLSCPFNPDFIGDTVLSGAVVILISALIVFFLIWKINERRNWARITYLVLCALSVPASVMDLQGYFDSNLFYGIIEVIMQVIDLYTLMLLFKKESGAWFSGSPKTGAQPT